MKIYEVLLTEQEIFTRLLKKAGNHSIFKEESKFEDNFVPIKLPHRSKELSLLAHYFLPILTKKNAPTTKILIVGNSGVGKTVTIKLFGESLRIAAGKRKIPFYLVFINCRSAKSGYKVVSKIVKSIRPDFPIRGYSPSDLLDILKDFIRVNNVYLLLILDELDYLIKNDKDLIYCLTRLNDDSYNTPQRLSIIGIVKSLSCINKLDSGTLSTLQKNIIRFANYSKEQIFDVLKYRAEMSLKNKSISDNVIRLVSNIIFAKGDIRHGLNLLWKAGMIAERKNLSVITEECVELGNQDVFPIQSQNMLADMSTPKLLFLFSIVVYLKKSNKALVPFLDAFKSYYSICETIGVDLSSHSELRKYLQEYKDKNFLTVKAQSKKKTERSGLIGVKNIPLKPFQQDIQILLASRGVFV